jgi:glycosyltransferase involved in cell wall biosynthesis
LEVAVDAKEPRRRIWFRRVAYELAHRVLSVSQQLKDLHAGRTGFQAERITVIHNGVDGRQFFSNPAVRARARSELNLSEKDFCIGCVGNLLPVKDHMTVLRAVERLGGAWRLVIVGEGAERVRLERFLDERPECKARVSLIGSSDRVPEILNAMDVYVLSSSSEGICNSLLEAMSTGLAVLATATGGNTEVVVDGESGLLFPVGDFARLARELNRLRARTELRRELGQEAIRRVRNEFSLDSMVRNYDELYETLGRRTATMVGVVARA